MSFLDRPTSRRRVAALGAGVTVTVISRPAFARQATDATPDAVPADDQGRHAAPARRRDPRCPGPLGTPTVSLSPRTAPSTSPRVALRKRPRGRSGCHPC